MGLHESNKPLGQYLAVKHFGIVMESSEPKEGYDEITVHNPKTDKDQQKWIKRFSSLDGKIKDIEWYDREHGGQRYMGVKVHVKDGGEHFYLDLPYQSRAYDTFTYVMDSIDYEKPVEFVAFKGKNTKQEDTTVFLVKQDGAVMQWNFTRDAPGQCPPAKQSKLGKWDFTERKEWLQERLVNKIIPHVKALNKFDEPEAEYTGDEYDSTYVAGEPPLGDFDKQPAPDEVGEVDDLPF